MEFQATIFEMDINGLISPREYGILETITECMSTDKNAIQFAIKATMEDLEDADIVDSIMAKKFYTALYIMGEEVIIPDIRDIGKVVDIDHPF